MQRYFIDSPFEENVIFTQEQTHHIQNVMRMTVGDQFYVVLKTGKAGIVTITSLSPLRVNWVKTVEETVELPVFVTIACGLPKSEKLEWITQKTTELGVYAIQPIKTQYAVVKWDEKKAKKKIERLQKIAEEAAEQSQRLMVPTINPILEMTTFVQTFEAYDYIFVAYEESAKSGENARFKKNLEKVKSDDKILVIFGSEGGLSEKEVTLFEQHGAERIGLGPRIMRCETAPLYVLSAISYELELK